MFFSLSLSIKVIIPNSDGLSSDTIFAFLMLNTMSPAHNKILGAKFLSFERLRIMCLYTVRYAVLMTKCYEIILTN